MLGALARPLAVAVVGLALFGGVVAAASDRAVLIAEPVAEAVYPLPGNSRARVWSQLIWDGRTKRLARRTLAFADPLGEAGLDLHWQGEMAAQLQGEDDRFISGAGVLTWRRAGAPRYGRENIVAQYQGLFSSGRFEGEGKWIHGSGTYYEGRWHEGLMHGSGQLLLPDGTAYSGQFEKGRFNGEGVLIDAAGNVHDGRFAEGLADGFGQVALESGETFSAVFRAGEPLDGSRQRVRPDWRFQQAKDMAAGGSKDLALSVNVAEKMPACCDAGPPTLAYRAISTPEFLQIMPNNQRLMDIWYGKRNVVIGGPQSENLYDFAWARMGAWEYAILNYTSNHIVPLRLTAGLQNKGNSNARIVGAYLDMEYSRLDARPVLQVTEKNPFGEQNIAYTIENFGWSPARDISLTFRFEAPNGQKSELQTLNIGSVDAISEFSFAAVLKKFAVNTSNNSYGRLADYVVRSGNDQGFNAEGTLHFTWTDADGKQVSSTSPFATYIRLRIVANQECEGGEFRTVKGFEPINLALDKGTRQVPVDIESAVVKPGKTERWRLEFQAKKSSTHVFRIVFKLSDGSEVRSRRIKVNIFKPRSYPVDTRPLGYSIC